MENIHIFASKELYFQKKSKFMKQIYIFATSFLPLLKVR